MLTSFFPWATVRAGWGAVGAQLICVLTELEWVRRGCFSSSPDSRREIKSTGPQPCREAGTAGCAKLELLTLSLP